MDRRRARRSAEDEVVGEVDWVLVVGIIVVVVSLATLGAAIAAVRFAFPAWREQRLYPDLVLSAEPRQESGGPAG
jgi:hypothetical protein